MSHSAHQSSRPTLGQGAGSAAGEASVASLLSLPELEACRVEAGRAGLGRAIRWVARLATPADALTVGAGDLVLDSSDGAIAVGGHALVRRLAECGAAGIAIPAGGNPGTLARWCESEGLPLVSLALGIGYRELTKAAASISFGLRPAPSAIHSAAPSAGASARAAPAVLLDALAAGDAASRWEASLAAESSGEKDWPALRAAVAAYLHHGRNAVAAAAELGVHRHTIRSRVRRFEVLSGVSLDDPDARLAASLAFRLPAAETSSPASDLPGSVKLEAEPEPKAGFDDGPGAEATK